MAGRLDAIDHVAVSVANPPNRTNLPTRGLVNGRVKQAVDRRTRQCRERRCARRIQSARLRHMAGQAGITLMAYGRRQFLWQARHLALSLRLWSPQLPLALVTDRPTHPTGELFDVVVPMRGRQPSDCGPKLDLDRYTPFEQTLYLDSDGLAVRDLQFILDRYADREFAVMGSNIDSGHWYGDVQSMCRLAGQPTIPKFSGGFMYFTKTDRTHAVFAAARGLAERYDQLAFDTFNRGIADEPLLSIALSSRGFDAIPTMPDTSISLLGVDGTPDIDVVAGHAAFTKNGRSMHPAVVSLRRRPQLPLATKRNHLPKGMWQTPALHGDPHS